MADRPVRQSPWRVPGDDVRWEECLATADESPIGHAVWSASKTDGATFQNIGGISAITFPDTNGNPAVRIECSDPPVIWVNPDLAWDAAAKQFWNAVYRCVGKPAPFPDL